MARRDPGAFWRPSSASWRNRRNRRTGGTRRNRRAGGTRRKLPVRPRAVSRHAPEGLQNAPGSLRRAGTKNLPSGRRGAILGPSTRRFRASWPAGHACTVRHGHFWRGSAGRGLSRLSRLSRHAGAEPARGGPAAGPPCPRLRLAGPSLRRRSRSQGGPRRTRQRRRASASERDGDCRVREEGHRAGQNACTQVPIRGFKTQLFLGFRVSGSESRKSNIKFFLCSRREQNLILPARCRRAHYARVDCAR